MESNQLSLFNKGRIAERGVSMTSLKTRWIVEDRNVIFKNAVLSVFQDYWTRIHGLNAEGVKRLLDSKQPKESYNLPIIRHVLDELAAEKALAVENEEGEKTFFLNHH